MNAKNKKWLFGIMMAGMLFGMCGVTFPAWADLPVPSKPTRKHQHLEKFFKGIDEIIIRTERHADFVNSHAYMTDLARESLGRNGKNIHRIIKEEMKQTLDPEILQQIKVNSTLLDDVRTSGEQNPHMPINFHALIVRFVFYIEIYEVDGQKMLVGAVQPRFLRLLSGFTQDTKATYVIPQGFVVTESTIDHSESLDAAFRTVARDISRTLNRMLKQKTVETPSKGENHD